MIWGEKARRWVQVIVRSVWGQARPLSLVATGRFSSSATGRAWSGVVLF